MKFKIILIGLLLLPIFAVSNSFAQEMEVIYYHNDTLGSPRAATDETGKKVLWRENYAPYGKKLENQQGEKGNHIGYTGKPHERITGFTYLNARYYDPVIGRFMAVDPVEYIDRGTKHFNRYAYAYSNPYKYTDPSGEAGIIGGIVGVGLEVGIQAYTGKFDPVAIGVSFGLGLVGANLVDKISKIATLAKAAKVTAEVATEAAVSVAKQGITDGEVALDKVAADVFGAGVAKVAEKTVKAVSKLQKSYIDKVSASKRARNIADKGRKRKAQEDRASAAEQSANDHGGAQAAAIGAASGSLGSKAAEKASSSENE
jgi:RHS repeat-associated protein